MIDKELIKKLQDNKDYVQLENYMDRLLEQNPYNIDGWLKLAVLVLIPGIADYEKSIYCCEQALKVDPNHLDSLVLLGAINHLAYGFIQTDVVERLYQVRTNDPDYESMIWLLKAWGIKDKKMIEDYEHALITSINFGPHHVLNYVNLASFYRVHMTDGYVYLLEKDIIRF